MAQVSVTLPETLIIVNSSESVIGIKSAASYSSNSNSHSPLSKSEMSTVAVVPSSIGPGSMDDVGPVRVPTQGLSTKVTRKS